jgi:hypothetical protein
VVSRPERKAGNKLYWDGEDWRTASPPAPSARRKKSRIWLWVLGIVLVLFLIGRSVLRKRASRLADHAIGKSKRKAALFVRKAGH